jgi:hypothetical protein
MYDAGRAGLTRPSRFGGRGAGPVEEYTAAARHHAPKGFTWEVDLHYRLRHVVALTDTLDPA